MNRVKSEIHMHSTFSDGEFTPEGLVDIAVKNKVSILSLTDHDTFEGIASLVAAAEKVNIFAFPGIEITVNYRDFNLHLLAYFKSIESICEELMSRVNEMKALREKRMKELIERINKVIPDKFKDSIKYENVAKAAEGVLGRPHLAKEMTRLKIVSNTGQAFDKYLVKYNVEKKNLDIETAISLIRKCNGVPVIAHPGERSYSLLNSAKGKSKEDVPEMLKELVGFGLLGLECIYPYHERSGTADYFIELSNQFDLIVTGSRDFHGFHTHQKTNILGSTEMNDEFLYKFKKVWGVNKV
jgi:predicted metal-dependent phosphoesterase TrpH